MNKLGNWIWCEGGEHVFRKPKKNNDGIQVQNN